MLCFGCRKNKWILKGAVLCIYSVIPATFRMTVFHHAVCYLYVLMSAYVKNMLSSAGCHWHNTFPMELQNTQQTHRFEHLSNVHLQTALKLDEQSAYFWVDFTILWSKKSIERERETTLYGILQTRHHICMAVLTYRLTQRLWWGFDRRPGLRHILWCESCASVPLKKDSQLYSPLWRWPAHDGEPQECWTPERSKN